jgi:hypothetical protein
MPLRTSVHLSAFVRRTSEHVVRGADLSQRQHGADVRLDRTAVEEP